VAIDGRRNARQEDRGMVGRSGCRLGLGLAASLLAGQAAAEPTAYTTVETLYIDTALGDPLQTEHSVGVVELEELGGGSVKLDAVIHRQHTWLVAGGAPLGCTVDSDVEHTYDGTGTGSIAPGSSVSYPSEIAVTTIGEHVCTGANCQQFCKLPSGPSSAFDTEPVPAGAMSDMRFDATGFTNRDLWAKDGDTSFLNGEGGDIREWVGYLPEPSFLLQLSSGAALLALLARRRRLP
jgi:hypothetical protein